MKKILMLGMGGTIASEMSPDGLAPELTPEQLLEAVPEISSICIPECRELYSIDSTDITPDHWISLVRTIRDLYDDYDGFVISHGTDTMAYTAAALSYMIQGSKKPVILTGSQKPMYSENTDSKVNLTDAFLCACSGDIHGVNIVFNGRVIQGTRARKTRSKSFQAFSSINYPDIAAVRGGRLMTYIRREYLLEPIFSDSLDANVGLMKLIPAQDFDLLEFLLERKDAVIIEGFGVGGLPSYKENRFRSLIEKYTARGKFVIMTTQVQNEGSDLSVYSVGAPLKDLPNVFEAFDMTSEAVYAKLLWILGLTRDPAEVRKLFILPVANDVFRPDTVSGGN